MGSMINQNIKPTTYIDEIPLHYLTVEERELLVKSILTEDTYNRPFVIFTPNPEIFLKSFELSWYKHILQQADWNMPDGRGLLWATTFLERTKASTNKIGILLLFLYTYLQQLFHKNALKQILPNVITGQDSFFQMHDIFQKLGTKVFYFGGENGVSTQMYIKMKGLYSGVDVVGACEGYPFRSQEEWDDILAKIAAAKPEVLFVALAFPKQEEWVIKNRAFLHEIGVKMVMIVGGTYDVVVGKIKRSPLWLKKLGFEFMWRIIVEPLDKKKNRIIRVLRAVFLFPLMILQLRLKSRLR